MVGGLFYTLKWSRLFINAKKIKVECTLIQSQSTVFSSSQAMETPKMKTLMKTANGNSKDDLSEIRFVFGMLVSPLWWYYRQEVLQKPILRAGEITTCFVSQKL